MSAVDKIIDVFKFETETNSKHLKNENSQMLYRIYKKYSFTPADVLEKVETQNDVVNAIRKSYFF